jgi:hypothetical protein
MRVFELCNGEIRGMRCRHHHPHVERQPLGARFQRSDEFVADGCAIGLAKADGYAAAHAAHMREVRRGIPETMAAAGAVVPWPGGLPAISYAPLATITSFFGGRSDTRPHGEALSSQVALCSTRRRPSKLNRDALRPDAYNLATESGAVTVRAKRSGAARLRA